MLTGSSKNPTALNENERKRCFHSRGGVISAFDIQVLENKQHKGPGKPGKDADATSHYRICATLMPKETAVEHYTIP